MPQAKPEALQVHRVLCHTLLGALSPSLLPEQLLVFPRALQRARAGSKGASSALGLCEQHSWGCDSTWQPAEPTGSSSPFPLHLLPAQLVLFLQQGPAGVTLQPQKSLTNVLESSL